ncbi:MAG: hypothetical protein ACO3QC_04450 [Phycisphaerales bacterium]
MTPSHLASTTPKSQVPAARTTVVIRVGDALVEVEKSIPDASSSNDGPCTQPLPRLRDGKTLPGPSEWRSLEAHAARLRLRGSRGGLGA